MTVGPSRSLNSNSHNADDVGERLDQLKRDCACGWRKNRTSVGRLRFLAPFGEVQVVTRRLVEQAAHLGAGARLAAVQQRLQTLTLGGQGASHRLPPRRGRRRHPSSQEGDPAELRDKAPFLRKLAPSSELLHGSSLSRPGAAVPPRSAARLCPARESTSRSRAGRICFRRCPPKHDGRRENKDGNRGAHAHAPTVPRGSTPAPCATVDRLGAQ